MAKSAFDWSGRIDGLINNAAYFREVKLTPFEEIKIEVEAVDAQEADAAASFTAIEE